MSNQEDREAPVTVAQMIEALEKLPPEARLFTSGYEGGYQDASLPMGDARPFALNFYAEWYYGPHEDAEEVNGNRLETLKTTVGYVL